MKKQDWSMKTRTGQALRLCVAAAALTMAQASIAASATGVMTVTATVASTCIVGASTLAFGSATSAAIQAANVDAIGNVTVNCTTGSAYSVALDKGLGSGSTVAVRRMTSGANLLSYTIYTTAARTTVWGDASGGSVPIAGTGTGAEQSIPAYGRILSGQTVPAATYTDTVNVTVTY